MGYLICGYCVLYFFFVAVGLLLFCVRLFHTKFLLEIESNLLMAVLPFMLALTLKLIIDQLGAKLFFLKRGSSRFAIDNYRMLNMYLYYNFFFDCFMGLLSGVKRLLNPPLVSLIMLPSKFLYMLLKSNKWLHQFLIRNKLFLDGSTLWEIRRRIRCLFWLYTHGS